MTPEDLLAYVDGELDPESRDRVERELALRPEWVGELSDLCRQRLLLAEVVRGPIPSAPSAEPPLVPASSHRLLAAIPPAPVRRRVRIAAAGLAAAAGVALVIGVILALAGRGATVTGPVAGGGAYSARPQPREVRVVPRRPADAASPVRPAYADPGEPDLPREDPPPFAEPERSPGAAAPAVAAVPESAPPAAPEKVAPPVPAEPPVIRTVAEPVLARVEAVSGKVQILRGPNNRKVLPAARDVGLVRGDAVQVQGKGRAVICYPDGCRLEAGPDTSVAFSTHTGDGTGENLGIAKKVFLRDGALAVEAVPQPEGLPLLLVTGQAEVRVLGTRFTLEAEKDRTHLEVLEGRVRMTRRQDGAVIEVRAGEFATTAPGGPLMSRPMRSDAGLIALYDFAEGQGLFVLDQSGAGKPIPLRIANPNAASWLAGSLLVHNPTIVASPDAATKIIRACKVSRELTVEAWVQQRAGGGGGYVVALASNPFNINFLLEQTGPETFAFHLRTGKTREIGAAVAARGPLPYDRPVHVVYTRAASGAGALYLDGVRRAEHVVPGDFSTWDDSYRLAVAGDAKGRKPWRGEIRLVAVYNRALTPAEVAMSFRAGAR